MGNYNPDIVATIIYFRKNSNDVLLEATMRQTVVTRVNSKPHDHSNHVIFSTFLNKSSVVLETRTVFYFIPRVQVYFSELFLPAATKLWPR